MCDKYNGWRNWETWNCNLWFDNFFAEDAANIYAMAEDESEAITLLESYIDETVTDLTTGDIPNSGFAADIINQALQAIDFREIAEHYIEDVVREEVYSLVREFYPVKQSRERGTGFYLSTSICFV